MKNQPTILTACLLLFLTSPGFLEHAASAERLSKSDLDSTLPPQCDLCWNPSSSERTPDRLPTFKPHRPRRPPDSRPRRYPKGRYKLAPTQKQSQLSMLRTKLRRQARLAGIQQIVVLEGDTIRVGSDRIRLRGIDRLEPSAADGLAAKQRLEELLRSGTVHIVRHGQDVHGGTIADVFVDGRNVAEILKSEGFTRTE